MGSSIETLARPGRTPASSRRKSSTAFSMRVLAWAMASLLEVMVVIGDVLRINFRAARLGGGDQRPDMLAQYDPLDVSDPVHIEHDDGHLILHAERDSRRIHHRQAALQYVQIAD